MAKSASRRVGLPSGSLDFCDQTCVPGADPAGIGIFTELPAGDAVELWRVLRLILTCARGDYQTAPFAPGDLARWEERLLRGPGDCGFRSPCAVIVGALVEPERADVETVARACLSVVEWALEGNRSIAVALAYAEAAALSWPANARYALAAGRLLRRNGRVRDAETWMNRARRLATHYSDHECVASSTSSLAMLFWDQGNFKQAQRLLTRAQRLARRYGLQNLEGEVLHNSLVVALDAGDMEAAESFAAAAFERYLPTHPKLPALAYDTAYLWLSRGSASRALRVFHALLPHFSDPRARIQVLCAMCKAAGAVGDSAVFARCAGQVNELVQAVPPDNSRAAALLDLGVGAVALGEDPLAEETLTRAFVLARQQGLSETVLRAEEILGRARHGGWGHARGQAMDPRHPQEQLAGRLAAILQACEPSTWDCGEGTWLRPPRGGAPVPSWGVRF